MADTFALDEKPGDLASVSGFRAGVASCGLKPSGPDVGVLMCVSAEGAGTALFAQSGLRAASVRVSSPRASAGRLRAVVINGGNANCLMGEDGLRDAREIVDAAASGMNVGQEAVLSASFGRAGSPLPMDKIRKGIADACKNLQDSGKGELGKVVASEVSGYTAASASGVIEGKPFRVAGVAKSASVSSPDMAKMFAFIVTDVVISPACLRELLIYITHKSFGMLTVDSISGPNDTICVLASGRAGNEEIDNVFSAGVFTEALETVACELASGDRVEAALPAGRLEARVKAAGGESEAEAVARAIADSVALRVALASGDPSWPLILAAAGRTGAKIDESKVTVRVSGELLFDKGRIDEAAVSAAQGKLAQFPIVLAVDLGSGSSPAVAWSDMLPVGNDTRSEEAERAVEEAGRVAEEAGQAAKEATAAVERAKTDMALMTREVEALKSECQKKSDEISKLTKDLDKEGKKGSGEAKKAQDEVKKVTIRLEKTQVELEQTKAQVSLKDQLVKQLLGEQKPPKKSKK